MSWKHAVFAAIVLCGFAGVDRAMAQATGESLYSSYCAGCHRPLASSGVKHTTAARIRSAINANAGGMRGLSGLSDAQLQAITEALNGAISRTVSGMLLSVAANSITVDVKGTQTVIPTTGTTAVTIKGVAAALGNLRAGMKLSVVTVGNIATKITATVPVESVVGSITGINGGTIQVQETAGPTSFATNGATAVTVKGTAASVPDLKVGMKVTAKTELGVATKITATVPVVTVAGSVTDVSGADLTVQAKAGPVNFTTDPNTKVTLKAKAATVADLKAGMKVTATTELGLATKVVATVPLVNVVGSVTNVSGADLTVQTKTGAVDFTTDPNTKVTLKAKVATVGDLKVGMKVTAKTELGVATKIVATVPVVNVVGSITNVIGANLTVQQTGGPANFTTSPTTKVVLAGKAATVGDLKAGMKATALTELGVATKITATIPVVTLVGTIQSINATSVVLQQTSSQATFDTDADTTVKVAGKAATFADLVVGMNATVKTELGVATSIVAK